MIVLCDGPPHGVGSAEHHQKGPSMTNPLLKRQFEIVREDMHRRYGSLHSADHIDALVDATIAERTAAAKVETFLPVIVERIVSETLEEQATAAGAKDPRARPQVGELADQVHGHLPGFGGALVLLGVSSLGICLIPMNDR